MHVLETMHLPDEEMRMTGLLGKEGGREIKIDGDTRRCGTRYRKEGGGRTMREEGCICTPSCSLAPIVITKLCNRLQKPAESAKNGNFPHLVLADGLISSRCVGFILLLEKKSL